MATESFPNGDKDLWRRLATGEVASAALPDLDFAAWLEGRLDAAAAARVEAAVAGDPELRRAALELADILGRPLPAAPPRLEVRARALVGFAAERTARRTGLLDWLFARDRRFVGQRVLALSAAVIVAVSGFLLGGGWGEQVASQRHAANWTQARLASTSTSTSASGSGELTDFLVSDGL